MIDKEIRTVAVLLADRGCTDSDAIQHSSYLLKAKKEEIALCIEYVNRILKFGANNFEIEPREGLIADVTWLRDTYLKQENVEPTEDEAYAYNLCDRILDKLREG